MINNAQDILYGVKGDSQYYKIPKNQLSRCNSWNDYVSEPLEGWGIEIVNLNNYQWFDSRLYSFKIPLSSQNKWKYISIGYDKTNKSFKHND